MVECKKCSDRSIQKKTRRPNLCRDEVGRPVVIDHRLPALATIHSMDLKFISAGRHRWEGQTCHRPSLLSCGHVAPFASRQTFFADLRSALP
jgi:hypothetical protein